MRPSTSLALVVCVLFLPATAGGAEDWPPLFRSPQHEALNALAQRHAEWMAAHSIQGHQGFSQRYAEATRTMGARTASEICAESWPWQAGDSSEDLWREMIRCWRQSPGHWSVVRRQWRAFGAGMARGPDGRWFACCLAVD
jgi:uncharacterized protein YkwD